MTVLTRSEWGAATPLGPRMVTPIRTIYIHHSVTPTTSNPAADFRGIDGIGKARFGRFSYSWVVHPSGVGGEGAGLHVGAHTSGQNSTSLGICLLGNFENERPTEAAINTVVDIINYLQLAGIVTRDARIRGHRDVKATACPGRNLYDALPVIRGRVAQRLAAPAPAPRPVDLVAVKAAVDAAVKHVLRSGSEGDAVKVLQTLLNNKLGGPDLVVDGRFGPGTEAAVKQFQTNTRTFLRLGPTQLPSDGIVGPATWFWLTR